MSEFLKKLSFKLTNAQKNAFKIIASDLNANSAMLRLLQGDVGSGKTVIAALATLQVIEQNYQVAIMVPTELLAEQHYKNFSVWFEPLNIETVLLTGKLKKSIRNLIEEKLKNKKSIVVIGTHALFQESIIFSKLGLVDTFIALPILYIVINLPFAIWMIKSFIDEIPKEIDESAYVEGCSTTGVIIKIIIPLIRPGIFATLVFCFIMAWNEFLIAYIFTRKEAITAPVGVARFITERQILWGYITAGATLASILPIVLLVIFQKNLVRGLTLGAVK